MMKFICFGSGSCGNCYYINVDKYGLLIDLGIGLRTFRKYFSDYGLSLSEVKGILVTHDHADHVKSAGAFSKEFHLPVYAFKDVYMGMERNRYMRKKVPAQLANVLEDEVCQDFGPFSVTPFTVPHDSAASCGYFIEGGGVKLCLMTDLGHVTDTMRSYLHKADHVIVEANYDANMLETGPYPQFLKERIRSGKGHLDNTLTAGLLAENLSPDAVRVWLCHLSEENNRPELALETVTNALTKTGRLGDNDQLMVEALPRTRPTRLYELGK